MSEYSKYSGMPPYVVDLVDRLVRCLDQSSLPVRPFYKLKFSGWKVLLLPTRVRREDCGDATTPFTETR